MSYIRCLSNPEGLYIWAQADGSVGISCLQHRDVLYMPTDVFEELLRRMKARWEAPGSYRGGSLKAHPGERFRYSKMRLKWKDWGRGVYVDAYEVTWHYAAQSVSEEEDGNKG